MKKITIRDILTPIDMLLFSQWVFRIQDLNCFADTDLILNYQKAFMLCADDEDGPICYLPVQSALFLRSLDDIEGCEDRARANGQREVYLLTNEEPPADWEQFVGFRILQRSNKTIAAVKPDSVLMLESLAPMPGLSARKEALALLRFGDAIDEIASHTGHAQSIFVCKDDRVADICKAHRYEEVLSSQLFRKKLEVGPNFIPKGEQANEVGSSCVVQPS